MNLKELKIGTKLEMDLVTESHGLLGASYVSQIIEVIDSGNLVIATPIANSRVVFIPQGFNIKITLLHKKYGLLGFTGKVTGKETRDNISVLCVSVEDSLERIQRRKYFRLDCVLNAEFRVCPEEEIPEEDADTQVKYKKALIKNISGSGACLVAEEEIERGLNLDVKIWLDTDAPLTVMTQVIRSGKLTDSKKGKYEIGLHFLEMSKTAREAIVKYIFEQQRIMLKKGLIDRE